MAHQSGRRAVKRSSLSEPVRQQLKRLPPPFDSHYGVVPLAPPEDTIHLGPHAAIVEEALAAIQLVDAKRKDFGPGTFYVRTLATFEAFSSSAIEDVIASADELSDFIKSGEGPQAAAQIHEYAVTLTRLILRAMAEGSAIFDRALVEHIHERLMHPDTSYRDIPGRIRTCVVWIGANDISTSTWNPPPPIDVAACLDQTLDYMGNQGMQQMTQNVIMRLAVAHAHFESVHPFRDGNGRVGRLLLPVMMAAEGHVPLFLSPYIEERIYKYFQALRAAQQRLDWSEMVGFFSEAIVATVKGLRIGL